MFWFDKTFHRTVTQTGELKNAVAGDRTRVTRVTGGNTHHYTTTTLLLLHPLDTTNQFIILYAQSVVACLA
jgi:hypothetical protein